MTAGGSLRDVLARRGTAEVVRPRARVIVKGPARLAGVAGCVDSVGLARPGVELVGLLDGP